MLQTRSALCLVTIQHYATDEESAVSGDNTTLCYRRGVCCVWWQYNIMLQTKRVLCLVIIQHYDTDEDLTYSQSIFATFCSHEIIYVTVIKKLEERLGNDFEGKNVLERCKTSEEVWASEGRDGIGCKGSNIGDGVQFNSYFHSIPVTLSDNNNNNIIAFESYLDDQIPESDNFHQTTTLEIAKII